MTIQIKIGDRIETLPSVAAAMQRGFAALAREEDFDYLAFAQAVCVYTAQDIQRIPENQRAVLRSLKKYIDAEVSGDVTTSQRLSVGFALSLLAPAIKANPQRALHPASSVAFMNGFDQITRLRQQAEATRASQPPTEPAPTPTDQDPSETDDIYMDFDPLAQDDEDDHPWDHGPPSI